ncbi:MAG: AAA family ATPase [Bacilli bacterium]|nr:AAA family ATPase [Bacilli bacterium]
MESNNIDISKDVAILLKKINVDFDTFVYLPVDVIIGKSDSEAKIFETVSGQCYWEMSENILVDNGQFCFIDDLTDIELMEMYGSLEEDFSYNDAIKNFFKAYERIIYFVNTNYKMSGMDYLVKRISIDEIFTRSSMSSKTVSSDGSFDDFISYLSGLQKVIGQLNLKEDDESLQIRSLIKPFTDSFVGLWNELCDMNDLGCEKYLKYEAKQISIPKEKVSNIKKNVNLSFNARKICDQITSTVIGQNEHVERLVYEILRLSMIKKTCTDKNSGILLTGSTGVGKTKILTRIGQLLDRPVLFVDSTQLSIPGYVGMSIEDFLQRLYDQEKGDMIRISNAIVVFDEIDKKGSSKNDDVSGRGVLNTLLKFLDGTTYSIKKGADISTDNMIVIFSGAFSNVYDYRNKSKASIGFLNSDIENMNEVSLDDFMQKAQFPDESMGRFPVLIHLNSLSLNDFVNILRFSDESDIRLQQKIFKELGFELMVDDTYYTEVARLAYDSGTGARALQKCVYDSTSKALKYALDSAFDGKESSGIITINSDTVHDPSKFIVSGYADNKVKKY